MLEWSAKPVLVPKIRSTSDLDKPRLTVNYRNVLESLPSINITYIADIHKQLSHPSVGSLCKFDLKHAY